MTEQEKAAIASKIEKLEKLWKHWMSLKKDREMEALIFEHEADRVDEELTVARLMLNMDGLVENIASVREDLKQILEEISETTADPNEKSAGLQTGR